MTHEKSSADGSHAHGAPGLRLWGALAHRWPTALGVVVAAVTAFDQQVDAGFVSSISALTVVIALVYVGAAALDRRGASWVVLLVAVPFALFVLPATGTNPSVVLLVAAAGFLALGAVRGRLREPGGLALQVAGGAGLRLDRAVGALRVPRTRRVPRGFGLVRPRRLGRLPLRARQGGGALVRGVLRHS